MPFFINIVLIDNYTRIGIDFQWWSLSGVFVLILISEVKDFAAIHLLVFGFVGVDDGVEGFEHVVVVILSNNIEHLLDFDYLGRIFKLLTRV